MDGQTVTIREDGMERQVSAAEAFLLHITKKGLEGDSAAARSAMTTIEKARADRLGHDGVGRITITRVYTDPDSVNEALETLRMARKLDRYRATARMALEPWLVEAALARLGDRRLTREEQETVLCATRTPDKACWPNWWEAKP